jgi:hypothetical protein
VISQLDLTLFSYSFALIAGAYFCIGSAFSRVSEMADLCESFWDYSVLQAKGLVLQASRYLVGALFLVASFLLQVAAVLVEPDSQPIPSATKFASLLFALVVLAAFSYVAHLVQRRLYAWREPLVLAELERRHPKENK